jgi:hypothetical protein
MAKRQFFGIKYPFSMVSDDNYFLDLNKSYKDKVKSQLLHVVLTPKGQRLRNPEFGTDLIKYIFELNDDSSWSFIKQEIQDSVSRWTDNIILNDINVLQDEENGHDVYVRLDYSVKNGNEIIKESIVTKV